MTFILHLFLERDQPLILRGTLQAVTQGTIEAFIDEKKLLEVLHRMILESFEVELPNEMLSKNNDTSGHC